jgi:asparagine synthase (glutamine-hydrolysing)
MCGFAGFIGGDWSAGRADVPTILARMGGAVHHRGPDHSAIWSDAEQKVALAHARLAIVDLSPAGDQPMWSATGRFVIVYNGELYNHADLRRELESSGHAPAWQGHSDTETLLAAIEAWGVEAALKRSIGMFAFALWDKSERRLMLARDRIGEKPLYYGWQGKGRDAVFLFGSELKALRAHPAFEGDVDRQALSLFMRLNYVPAPYSIYRGIHKLQPGSILSVGPDREDPVIRPYWSALDAARAGRSDPAQLGPEEAVDGLEQLLKDAVGRQMLADVPLGAFLSGGVDSSTVVALMQAQSSRPVQTFSIGFHEAGYDEAAHAKAVAAHLGTDHSELYVSAERALAVIPKLPESYDEPFADSSQIPTFLVAQMARKSVKVALSGDGGDELFGGYERYRITDSFWRNMSRLPRPMRSGVARGINRVPAANWNSLVSPLRAMARGRARQLVTGDNVKKAGRVLSSTDIVDLYRGMTSHWPDTSSLVLGGNEPPTWQADERAASAGFDNIERMMALDLVSYLPDDILVKVDRASMAVSLEARVPFLDHRVVEYAWRLPLAYKLRDKQSKWVLRQVLHRHVPRALIDRPKVGFTVPLAAWLRGPLRDWAEDLLDAGRLRDEGYLNPELVRSVWEDHRDGRINQPYQLWNVLMFQAWLQATKNNAPGFGDMAG